MIRGKLVILFIFGLSAVMGGYAWWHHYHQGRRSLEFWGADAAALIRYAPQVEILRLSNEPNGEWESLQVDQAALSISQRRDITGTPGLVHARQALIEDQSFAWDHAPSSLPAEWYFALRFTEGERRVVVLWDRVSNRVRLLEGGQTAELTERMMNAYRSRFPVWLPD